MSLGPLPLNALKAFEAAARHLSFTKAAAELNVTPAAVSHQIRGLEGLLGVKLFRRLNRALLLTDAGQLCLPKLREGFASLAEAMQAVRRPEDSRVLTVSMVPAFAAKWLVPRLERFREAEPKIDVRIHGSMERVDFAREPVDMAIRYGTGVYPGLRVDLLMDNEVFPVCSPRLQRGLHPLRKPEDLRHHTLLHLEWDRRDDTWPDWRMWLLAAGARGVDPTRGPRFSQSDFAIEAAIDGQGVALTGRALTSADLAAGRLVRPFELSMPTRFCYYVVCPQARAEEPKIAAFRDWVLAEARGEA